MKLPSFVPLLLTAAGVGLALAALWTKTVSGDPKGYWATDGTLGGTLLGLIVLSALLVALAEVLRREWPRIAAACLGAVLLGLFSLVVAFSAPQLDRLGVGAWLGIAGAVLIVLSTAPGARFADASRRPSAVSRDWSPIAWLVAATGLGLGIGSLWLNFFQFPRELRELAPSIEFSYWSIVGDHSLGIVMLVVAIVGVVATLAAAATRIRLFGAWALGISLLFFGFAFFYPVALAFNDLGQLDTGG